MADEVVPAMGFCVYEHWRPDLNVCFYVGKGKLRRARSSRERNDRHAKVCRKLAKLGQKPEVRIFANGLSEKEAFAIEIQRIAHWRGIHNHLTNMSHGGDGSTGYRFTEEQKDKIRQKAIGRVLSDETRAKMVAARTGLVRTAETRAKQSISAKVVQKERRLRDMQDPAQYERIVNMARKAAADPIVREKRALNAKALWADPEYRNRVLTARAAARVSKAVIRGFS